jgi:hypothetical protein
MVALHHGLEDADIFPHLRSCETDLEPVIDRLSEEHTIIHDVLENLNRALVELVANPQDERWTSLPTRSSHIFRMRNTNWSNRSRVMSSTTARFVEGMSPPTRSGSARWPEQGLDGANMSTYKRVVKERKTMTMNEGSESDSMGGSDKTESEALGGSDKGAADTVGGADTSDMDDVGGADSTDDDLMGGADAADGDALT